MNIEIVHDTNCYREINIDINRRNLYLRYNKKEYPLINVYFNNVIKKGGNNIDCVEELGKILLKKMGEIKGVYTGIDCLSYLRAKTYYIKPKLRKGRWY